MKISSLTPVEEQMMQLLWKLNSFYLKDVMTEHPEPKPHQNTISTYLKILVEKGYLKTEKEGRIFKYSVAIPLGNYKENMVKDLVMKFFEKDKIELLKLLLQQNFIAKEDLLEIFDLKMKIKEEKKEKSYPLAKEILKGKNKKDKGKKEKNKKNKTK
jgi:predicted transcriptional regulator